LNEEALLYSLILLMVVFWSGNYIVGKVALREFPPLLLIGWRLLLAGFLILPLYWLQGRQQKRPVPWREWPALLCLGLFGVSLNQLLFVVGLSRTSVAHSALIVGLGPLLVLLLAAAIKQEHLTARKATGMAVALAGVCILKAFESHHEGGPTWVGDICVFLSQLAFALFTVFGKRVTNRHSAVTVNTFGYVGGALALLPVTLWGFSGFSYARVSTAGWASVFYMALFPSVLAYLIYYHALKFVPASRISAFSYLQPVLATAMGVVLLGERITGSLLVGGTVIFSGVYLTERG
jgi:drug/metabolite transporter (DMT)-like permease